MNAPAVLRLVVLISGRGSNLVAIARAGAAGRLAARVVRVLSDEPAAGGLTLARELGLHPGVVARSGFGERDAFEAALGAEIDAARPDLVILAGFMRVLSPAFTARYAGRMLNIHPSLLPAYRGLHTHARVLAAGDALHGATVHFVTADLDGGPAVLQARVPVLPGDTVASLSARVQQREHIIYPKVIGWIAAGRLRCAGDALWLDGRPLTTPLIDTDQLT
ncbi:MAG: phosphoribosylglycinamide formyltransferase [Gammaproteobacteria bacterium]|nr:phosphoribosylglycinamide formyltransferase [Gammaproteobacteria bacterium]